MPSVAVEETRGGPSGRALAQVSARPEAAFLSAEDRQRAFERFEESSAQRERPGRYWKIDLDALDLSNYDPEIANPGNLAEVDMPPHDRVVVTDLLTASRRHPDVFRQALGSALGDAPSKFAALARAFASGGAFVYVPPGVALDAPIELNYRPRTGASFPYTLVVAGDGAQCTVVVRTVSDATGVLSCGVTEVVAGERARVDVACVQSLAPDAVAIGTCIATGSAGAFVHFCSAQFGARLAIEALEIDVDAREMDANISLLFFPRDEQHVDVLSTVEHRVGDSRSDTLVKSAASGAGQARYLGNIRIHPSAHLSDARLKDDALLLSRAAHIDSVPALEIAANDVKAYHGATVGAIDEALLFYMESRGLDPQAAERMIALGFFEPAVERFPASVRAELRDALEAKVKK